METHVVKRKLPRWATYLIFGLLCLGVLFVLRVIRPRALQTTHSLVFQDIYRSSPTVEIAGFSEGERWKGAYTLDSERSIDGETGMNIFSMNAATAKITLQKYINLKAYDTVYAYLFISGKENLQNIKTFTVGFADSKGNHASYAPAGLKTGWNLIRMNMADFKPKINPADITSVTVEFTSKKGQTSQMTLSRIWAQQPLKTGDFAKVDKVYTNLETVNKKTYLHLSSPEPVNTFFAKSTRAPRFSYTVGLSPLKFGMFGLSFLADPQTGDGYYLLASGKLMNEWRLLKKTGGSETELQRGTIPQNSFEKGAMIWLRAEKDGDGLSFSYTVNGQQYLPIAKLKDRSFDRGNFGILSTGSYLIDSVDVKE